jgi:arylsulfatase A-like enzyme
VLARLVDARHQTAAHRPPTQVPAAEIAGERRVVLANEASVRIFHRRFPPPGARRVSLDVPIPERLRGRALRLASSVQGGGAAITGQTPRVVATPGATVTLEVDLSREVDKGVTVVVAARPGPPETSWESAPIAIPAGATLRFGIGVDESEWTPAAPVVRFTLTALAGAGEAVLFRRRLDPGTRPEHRRWFDHTIDLSAYAGQTIRLRFASDARPRDESTPFVFPVWSDPTVLAPATAPPPRNLLLISLDTLRADHLGTHGYGRPTTPAIDAEIAARGTVFERAFATSPWTFPSHAAMLTGLYSCTERFVPPGRDPQAGVIATLPADAHTLAEAARLYGFTTAAFTEDGWISAEMGFARGFGTMVENRAFPHLSEPLGQVERTMHDALAWIRKHRDVPWFVFVHTYQVHNPYTPPPGYLARVAPEHGADRAEADRAAYDAEIRYTDDVLGRFLAGLEAAGAADALLALVSDHGEGFNEHGLFMHGNSLYDELLHVPLILRAPGLVPAGQRIGSDVGLIDVMPTLLDLLGLPLPGRTEGRSLVPLLRGDDGSNAPALFADVGDKVAVRHGGLKWIVDEKTGSAEVFDLASDPKETRSVLGTRALPREPAAWLAEFRRLCPRTGPAPPVGGDRIDPAVRDKLRALGYLE